MLNSRLYAITDTQLSNFSHVEIVTRLLASGVRLIQIRDKESSAKELLEAARACLQLTRPLQATLIINDRVDVALAADADGVHLGQDDLSVAEARALLGPNKIIGISTHSFAQVEKALVTSANYLAVGPVFPTTSKINPDPVVGLELVRKARQISTLPLVAIGGIKAENAAQVIAAGADSVAVIGALYPMPNVPSLTEDFQTAISARPDIPSAVQQLMGALDNA